MRRSFAFKITLLTLVWLLGAIACEQVPGSVFWPAVFGALTVPLALVATGLLGLFWLRRRRRLALLPALALGLAWPQVQRGLPLHFNAESGRKKEQLGTRQVTVQRSSGKVDTIAIPHSSFLLRHSPKDVLLLSANVRVFNVYAELREPDNASSIGFIRWLAESPADVLCLQEFYHEPQSPGEDGELFRTAYHLGAGSGRYAFVSKSLTNAIGAEFGLAIFSRFPLVRRGTIAFGRLTQNHAMWADLARPAVAGRRADTIRVFNLHLQSMSMDEDDIVAATQSRTGLRQKAPNLLRRFRKGAVARAAQVDTVLAHVARSPYPVLLAGDLNDLPYSYPYTQLAAHLQNAWASTGLGIGATYNGRLPGLRIDQQFASPHWQVLGCRVHREIRWSDHFPLEGLYSMNNKQ